VVERASLPQGTAHFSVVLFHAMQPLQVISLCENVLHTESTDTFETEHFDISMPKDDTVIPTSTLSFQKIL